MSIVETGTPRHWSLVRASLVVPRRSAWFLAASERVRARAHTHTHTQAAGHCEWLRGGEEDLGKGHESESKWTAVLSLPQKAYLPELSIQKVPTKIAQMDHSRSLLPP